jgi:hypothetical protein
MWLTKGLIRRFATPSPAVRFAAVEKGVQGSLPPIERSNPSQWNAAHD